MNHRRTWVELFAAFHLCMAPALAAETGAATQQQVQINEIRVAGNSLLPQSRIDLATAPYKGKRTAAEMQAAAAAVQALYSQAGYGGVLAFLPEQRLDQGVLLITVVESRLAQVVVQGNRQFSAANVRRSLPSLAEGQTPRVRALDTQIQLANENPSRLIAVTLEEGQQAAEVDARVIVSEEPVQRFKLSLDDTGNAQTGRTRLNAAYQHAALSDRDDQFVAQVQVSPERFNAVRVFSAGYRLPLYQASSMLQAYASYSNVEATGTATSAGDLRFAGKGRLFGVQLTRFVGRRGDFEQRLSLAVDQRDYLNDCAIQGLPEGACGSAGASVTVQPLTLGYEVLRRGARPAGLSVSLSTNLALGGKNGSAAAFEAIRAGSTRRYSVLYASGYGSLPFGSGWQLGYRAFLQATPDALVPGERFGLTTVGIVRGYEEREVTGDSAVAGSVELLSPALFASVGGSGRLAFGDLRLLAFVDAGAVFNQEGLPCDGAETRCQLSAVGIGVRFAVGPSQWRILVARANNAARETERGDVRLHFLASIVLP